jgi:triose/dihydroxyacetone kinase / FAD-AMP lyase (cyclizing)
MALLSIWTNALAAGLASGSVSGSSSTATSALWAVGLAHALTKLYNYTAARPPSRTLVDPLAAFTESFSGTSGGDFDAAFKAAFEAAQNTRNIEATAGRAAYVGQDELKAQRVPDPGAWGVIKILQGIQSVL